MVFKSITGVGGDNKLSSNSPATFTPPPPPPPGPPAPPPPPSTPPTPTQDTTTTSQDTQTPTTSPSTSQQESQISSGTTSASQQAPGNDTQQTTVKTMTGQINPIIGKDEAVADLLREKQRLEVELQLKKLQAEISKAEAEMKEAKGSGVKKVKEEDYRELRKKVNVFEPPIQPPMQQPQPQQPQLPLPPPQPTISKIDINGIVCRQCSCKAILSTDMGEFSVTDGTNLPDGSRVEKVDSKGVYIVDASGRRLYKPLDLYIPANQGDSSKKSNKPKTQPQTQPSMIPQSPYIQNYGSGPAQPMPPFINRNPVGGY
jgi:type IV pilus biogenesis protein PilP